MTVYHIFYDSNKDIAWSSTAGVTDAIKTEQKSAHNYDYVQIDHTETPVGEKYYINSDGDALVEKSTFDPTFSTTAPAVDAVVNVTGVPSGTEVFLDGVSAGTMSDTTLTLTAKQAGRFDIVLKKERYYDYTQMIKVKRYAE
jgi:hypothetical protein